MEKFWSRSEMKKCLKAKGFSRFLSLHVGLHVKYWDDTLIPLSTTWYRPEYNLSKLYAVLSLVHKYFNVIKLWATSCTTNICTVEKKLSPPHPLGWKIAPPPREKLYLYIMSIIESEICYGNRCRKWRHLASEQPTFKTKTKIPGWKPFLFFFNLEMTVSYCLGRWHCI